MKRICNDLLAFKKIELLSVLVWSYHPCSVVNFVLLHRTYYCINKFYFFHFQWMRLRWKKVFWFQIIFVSSSILFCHLFNHVSFSMTKTDFFCILTMTHFLRNLIAFVFYGIWCFSSWCILLIHWVTQLHCNDVLISGFWCW